LRPADIAPTPISHVSIHLSVTICGSTGSSCDGARGPKALVGEPYEMRWKFPQQYAHMGRPSLSLRRRTRLSHRGHRKKLQDGAPSQFLILELNRPSLASYVPTVSIEATKSFEDATRESLRRPQP
jgi:hypothetical protein